MEIIDDAKKKFAVKDLCAAVGVKRNTYYARLKSAERVDPEREDLKAQTIAIHDEVDACYGSRRISAELLARGYQVGRYKARALMQECQIEANMPKPPVKPKVGGKQDIASPNILNREFAVSEPDTRWQVISAISTQPQAGPTWPS